MAVTYDWYFLQRGSAKGDVAEEGEGLGREDGHVVGVAAAAAGPDVEHAQQGAGDDVADHHRHQLDAVVGGVRPLLGPGVVHFLADGALELAGEGALHQSQVVLDGLGAQHPPAEGGDLVEDLAIVGERADGDGHGAEHGLVQGPRGTLDGLNLVGLKRRGAARGEIAALRDLIDALSRGSFRESARVQSEAGPESALVREVLDFILGPSDRSFLTPK